MFEFPMSLSFLAVMLSIYIIVLCIKELVRISLMLVLFKSTKKSIKKLIKQLGNYITIEVNTNEDNVDAVSDIKNNITDNSVTK